MATRWCAGHSIDYNSHDILHIYTNSWLSNHQLTTNSDSQHSWYQQSWRITSARITWRVWQRCSALVGLGISRPTGALSKDLLSGLWLWKQTLAPHHPSPSFCCSWAIYSLCGVIYVCYFLGMPGYIIRFGFCWLIHVDRTMISPPPGSKGTRTWWPQRLLTAASWPSPADVPRQDLSMQVCQHPAPVMPWSIWECNDGISWDHHW